MIISTLNRYYISMSLSWLYFWNTLAIPYFISRGLTSTQALELLSIYSLLCLLLEYPTGVFGDVFGYKLSISIGNFTGVAALIMLSLPGNFPFYLIGLSLLATANTFQSGSDVGLLKHLTSDIKTSSANYKFITDLVLVFSAIVGGAIGQINYQLALYLNALIWLLAGIFIHTVNFNQLKHGGNNVFSTAINGIKYSLTNQQLFAVVLIFAIIQGFAINIKSLFGSFNDFFSLPVNQIGYLVGFGILCRAFGAKAYPKYNFSLFNIGLIISTLVVISGLSNLMVAIFCLFAAQYLVGFFIAKSNATTHELVVDHYRASVFSFQKLLGRILTSGHLWVIGLFLTQNNFKFLMIVTGSVILLGLVGYQFATRTHSPLKPQSL